MAGDVFQRLVQVPGAERLAGDERVQRLPCLTVPGILYCPEDATPEMIVGLEAERDRLTERIQFLTRNRDAITDYVQAARRTNGTDVPADATA